MSFRIPRLTTVRLDIILTGSNKPINAIEIRRVAQSLFRQKLTLEQAGRHLEEIDAALRPLYAITLRFLDTGGIRGGNMEEVFRLCQRHWIAWDISTLQTNETVGKEYIEALELHFPSQTTLLQFPSQTTLGLMRLLRVEVGDALGQVMEDLAKVEIPSAALRRNIICLIFDAIHERRLTAKPEVMEIFDKSPPVIHIAQRLEREQAVLEMNTAAEHYVKQMNCLVHFFRGHLALEDIDLLIGALDRWKIDINYAELDLMTTVFRSLSPGYFFAVAQKYRREYLQFLKAVKAKSDEDVIGVPRKMWVLYGGLSQFVDVETVPLGVKSKGRIAAAIRKAFEDSNLFKPEQPFLLEAMPLLVLHQEKNHPQDPDDNNPQETYAVLFQTIYEKGYDLNIPIIGSSLPRGEIADSLLIAIAEVLVDNYFSSESPVAKEAKDCEKTIQGYRFSIKVNKETEQPLLMISI